MTDTSGSTSMAPRMGEGGLAPRMGTMVSSARVFYTQPGVQRALPTIAAAVLVIAGLIFYIVLQTPDRTTLFASLPETEKAKVLETLRNSGTDVQVDATTGEITVPVGDYHSARLNLAAQGLPSSVPDGYSTLSDMPMGTSRSVEGMRLKQTQEVELARSIAEIDVVASARVHLAIPEKSAFARNAQKPTASVFAQLNPGRSLSSQQVVAIVNLVSSSVPNLPKSGVTVVDQNGRLLSDHIDDPASNLSDKQLQYRLRLEGIYKSRIEALLTPVVGVGNISAQVNLDIDFTRREITEDRVLPDSVALISEQSTSEQGTERRARGVPGALANSVPAQATLNKPAAGDADAEVPAGTQGGAQSRLLPPNGTSDAAVPSVPAPLSADPFHSAEKQTRNYEISRQVVSQKAPSAQIERIHVAVLLREPAPVAGPDGVVPEPTKLSDESRAELEQLVQNAVGLNITRGDSVNITSRPFIMELSDGVSTAWYEDRWLRDMAQNMITVLILAVVALGVVRPLMSRLLIPSGDVGMGTVTDEDGEEIDMDLIEVDEGLTLEEMKAKLKPKKTSGVSAEMLDTANSYDDKVAVIRMIVSDEAARVSNVFKAMMRDEMDKT
ncbi:MAG: flagellar M-ring protein FliF [Marinovum sp.]|nr:flagellar M-ring protein FliF [Marinovum sp.]